MAQEGPKEDLGGSLDSLLSSYQAFITYQPLRTEVLWSGFIRIPERVHVEEIPPRASLDPAAEAARIRGAIGSHHAALFIPGRRFDAFGTRHGQGGGWYDRFLADVPREWLRIGFCFDDQFSREPLRREDWDQAMDYVVVVNRKTGVIDLYSSDSNG